ncbi:MAG: AAA family ATPase [Candidatus Diapherotrites archaeon]|nr:AAA family ATPase [Candidatus Diapherotrites archaeon]
MVKRVKSYISGLDKMLNGGFPENSVVIINGGPGTGKTIICTQIAYYNALNGNKVVLFDLEQNREKIIEQMKQFKWSFEKVKRNMEIITIEDVEKEKGNYLEYLLEKINKTKYDIIVIDSLDSIITYLLKEEDIKKIGIEKIKDIVVPAIIDAEHVERMKIKHIFEMLTKSKATSLITSEKVDGEIGNTRDKISEFLCDGMITLNRNSISGGLTRTIEVVKMRRTNIDSSVHSFDFKKGGIFVE